MKFLREYTNDEASAYASLVEQSIRTLPSPLAKPVASLAREVEKGNFSAAMNYSLDFLEISIQFVTCCLFTMLQKAEEGLPPDERKLKAVVDKIDTKRSLSMGDWVNDMFNPVVKAAVKSIPQEPLVRSVWTELFSRGANRLLGTRTEPSVVRIRNEYKGHSTTLSNEIYRSVTFTLEPQILAMLNALRPLQECVLEFSDRHSDLNCGGTTYNLFPLVFSSTEGYIYVFQSLKDEEISYISSDEDAVTLIGDTMNAEFDLLMQRTLPSFDISKEANWTEMRACMAAESRRFLNRVYREKKYNRELFVDRSTLESLLSGFIASDKTLFPLLGEAGQGKTNQLCRWTEKIMDSDDAVLTFSSSDFAGEDLTAALRRIFGTSARKSPDKIVSELHDRADQEGRTVYIFFDAVNECLDYHGAPEGIPGPVSLYEAFRSVFIKPGYDRFKLLFTCRSYSWKTLFTTQSRRDTPLFFGRDGGQDTEVHGFSEDELSRAWDIYQKLYQMEGSFADLSKVSLVRLRDPLILKIACTNHVGQALPRDLGEYSSIALFREMAGNIARSYAGRQQHEIMLGIAAYMLDEYGRGRPADRIDSAELRSALGDPSAALHGLAGMIYGKSGLSVAYTELLNKPDRPILRYIETSDGRSEIQFIYERFLEFLMAVVFVQRNSSGGKAIPPETYIEALRNEGGSVVYMGALRNALIMDWCRTGDDSTVMSLMRDHDDNYEVSLLAGELLNVLIRENYEDRLFSLMEHMLDEPLKGRDTQIRRFNELTRAIQSNKADGEVIAEHRKLQKELSAVLSLGRRATASIVNGMFLTDWFNSGLYTRDPYGLLWKLVRSPLLDIGNDACMYIYYLNNKTRTLEYSPIRENISDRIVARMFSTVMSRGLVATLSDSRLRSQAISFVETGARLAVMLMFEEMLYGEGPSSPRVSSLMKEIRGLMSYLTWNFRLIKAVMPFFRMILRRQITFQSDYVNNAVEYQSFWDENVIPYDDAGKGRWCRKYAAGLSSYFVEGWKDGFQHFRNEHDRILQAYLTGDSFSYFILERLLAVAGISSWENIAPVVRGFFSDSYRNSEWFDYSQMSMLYVLYQVQKKSPEYNPELMEIYSREAADWTLRCKGLFRARNSARANTTGLYKRNVMNWYCDVYCAHSGDDVPHEGDAESVPVFREMIVDAVQRRDKTLLCHLLDNVSELISDNGLVKTALSLLLHTMKCIPDAGTLAEIDSSGDGRYPQSTVQTIGNVLATAKNYFPSEVDAFLKRDVTGLSFPGVAKYRDEVLGYSPGGESLSDLFTHSFGNFVIWSLVNFGPFKEFSARVIGMSADASDCFEWYDMVIREGFRTTFNVKL